MLELPEGLQGIGYMRGLDLYFWFACIAVLFGGAVAFIWKGTRAETPVQKKIYAGYGLFAACYGVTRIMYTLGVLIPDYYDEYTIAGYVFGLAALAFIINVVERYLLKDVLNTRQAFTTISASMLAISVLGLFGVIARYAFLYFLYAVIIADVVILCVLFGFLVAKTTGELRRKTVLSFLGIVVVFLGNFTDSELFLSTFRIPLVIPPILHIVGLAIFGWTQLRE
ncbi:MAG: hypothetical protein ACTSU5_05230 [Promethearchaeota archaeon]